MLLRFVPGFCLVCSQAGTRSAWRRSSIAINTITAGNLRQRVQFGWVIGPFARLASSAAALDQEQKSGCASG
jgi:hypothetical protein